MRRRIDGIAKQVEDNFVTAEAKLIAKSTGFVPKVLGAVRKKFIRGELRSRRYRHLAFLENFEREFADYKQKVLDYRMNRQALMLFFKPLPEEESESSGAESFSPNNPGGQFRRVSDVWDASFDDDDDDDLQRKSTIPVMTEEQLESLKALRAIQIPEHPFYLSYVPAAKDERFYEDLVSRCMKDPDNTFPLFDGRAEPRRGSKSAPRKNSGTSDASDALDFMFDKDDADENLETDPTRIAAFPRPPAEAPSFGALV